MEGRAGCAPRRMARAVGGTAREGRGGEDQVGGRACAGGEGGQGVGVARSRRPQRYAEACPERGGSGRARREQRECQWLGECCSGVERKAEPGPCKPGGWRSAGTDACGMSRLCLLVSSRIRCDQSGYRAPQGRATRIVAPCRSPPSRTSGRIFLRTWPRPTHR